jgi:hypothetical protein
LHAGRLPPNADRLIAGSFAPRRAFPVAVLCRLIDSCGETVKPNLIDVSPVGAPDSTPTDLDAVFDVLANSRRRIALQCVCEHAEMTLPDLAEEVAVREFENRIRDIPAERVRDVYFSLYHTHIPKLSATGFVEYHQDQDVVVYECRCAAALERARDLLAAIANH